MAISISNKSIFGKLNEIILRVLPGAGAIAMSKTNFNVELEHLFVKLVADLPDSDLARILKHYDIDPQRVIRQLNAAIERFRTGNSRTPDLSSDIPQLIRDAWLFGSMTMGAYKVRTGHLLVALLSDPTFRARFETSAPDLAKIPVERLVAEDLKTLQAGTMEDLVEAQAAAAVAPGGQPGLAPGDSRTPHLDQYTVNMTALAKAGKIDPVIGRDDEIRQTIDILCRRRQNNPILVGEAGVGKTAVVEGFACRIVEGDVPEPLKQVQLRTLDLGLLQAGAGMKGEFENRLKGVIAEVQKSPIPIILFIDEAHTLMGAGGGQGMGDAANLLKPPLARGELRTIGATTWAEYKKSFETDPALKRRFQPVKVDEPNEKKAIRMMRSVVGMLERHHKVRILESAVEASVKLTHRYVADRQLPDKSVSVLDTACAKVALSQSSRPGAVEDAQRRIEFAKAELAALEKEAITGADHDHRLTELKAELASAEADLARFTKQLEEERKWVAKIQELRGKLEKGASLKADAKDQLSAEDTARLRAELAEYEGHLARVQGENPLIYPVVDGQAVASIIASWTGIPVGRMVKDEIANLLTMKERLEEKVVGQSHALDVIAEGIRLNRSGLADPRKPVGVFLLVGPSGVGKTETALALAEQIYGSTQSLVTINMSEFKEEHKVSMLLGAPPGYKGMEEGGKLTEAVRRRPNCILLLDELEKSHESVQEIFYQVFDKGMLADSRGVEVDFKNVLILMTANVASDEIAKLCKDPETAPDAKGLAEAIRPTLLQHFKPAFLGRLTVLPYFPLSDSVLKQIIRLKLRGVAERLATTQKARFEYGDDVVNTIASRCTEVETGARNAEKIISQTLLPEVAKAVLTRMAEGKPISKVQVGVGSQGDFTYAVV